MSIRVLYKDTIIEKIEANNPGKFDYSPLENWEYDHEKGWGQQITLICKKHDEPFKVNLQYALRNEVDCPLCIKEIKRERCINSAIDNMEKFFPGKYEVLFIDQEGDQTLECYATLKCKDCGEVFEIKLDTIRSCYRQISLCKGCKTNWTEDFYLERLNLLYEGQYELISDIINSSSIVTLKCKYCGNIIEVKASASLAKPPCKCLKEKMTPELFIQKSKEVWGEDAFEYLDFNLKCPNQSVTLKCKKHNEVFTQKYHSHLEHCCGCPQCQHETFRDRNLLSNEEFIRRCESLYGDQFTYELIHYDGNINNVIVTCKDHGPVEVNARSLMDGKGCPLCRRESDLTSNGEKFLLKFFERNNINFNYQKTFEGCVYKKSLVFDFYLPDYNCCIEYQGKQHYFPQTWGVLTKEQAEETFKIQQIRDQIKREFCKKENINLIEIPYKRKLYDVGKELAEYLNLSKPL